MWHFLNVSHFKWTFFTPASFCERHTHGKKIFVFCFTKFHLNQAISPFWTKFAQKGYFWFKIENLNIIIELSIFKKVLVSNFILNRQFRFFDQIRVLSVQNRTNEHHLQFQHFLISLASKFHLKHTIINI